MSNIYFLVPTDELETEMVHFSTSNTESEFVTKTFGGEDYYLIEVDDSELKYTDAFKAYRKFPKTLINDATPPSVQKRKLLIIGIFLQTAPVNTTTTYSYTLTQDFLVDYIEFKAFNSNFGDDIDIGIYNADDTLRYKFVHKKYVSDDLFMRQLPRKIVKSGLKLKLDYTNVSLITGVKFYLNVHGFLTS